MQLLKKKNSTENTNNSSTCAREPRSPEAPLGQVQVHMLFFTLAPRHALPVRSSWECGQWPSTVGPASLVKEPLGIFCRARRRADKTLSRSKSASFTSAAPYQLRFKGPQSRCFSREWLYGFELCFQTPWLIISQPLEMFALYWQLAQREVGGLLSYLRACKNARLFGDSGTCMETSTNS